MEIEVTREHIDRAVAAKIEQSLLRLDITRNCPVYQALKANNIPVGAVGIYTVENSDGYEIGSLDEAAIYYTNAAPENWHLLEPRTITFYRRI